METNTAAEAAKHGSLGHSTGQPRRLDCGQRLLRSWLEVAERREWLEAGHIASTNARQGVAWSRQLMPLATRDGEGRVVAERHVRFPEMGIGNVTWQKSKQAAVTDGHCLPTSSNDESKPLLEYRSTAQSPHEGVSTRGSGHLSREQVIKEHEKLKVWLMERRKLGQELEACGDAKVFIQRNPPNLRTSLDERVLGRLETPKERGTRPIQPADHPKTNPLQALFDRAYAEEVTEEDHRLARLQEERDLSDQKLVLQSMEAVDKVLRKYKYRVEAMFRRLDAQNSGKLSRPQVEKVFSTRAFHVEPKLLSVFLDHIPQAETGEIEYGLIVPMDGQPFRDTPLVERWPGHLSLAGRAFLKSGRLCPARPTWGSSQKSVTATSDNVKEQLAQQQPGRISTASASNTGTQLSSTSSMAQSTAPDVAKLEAHCEAVLKPPAIAQHRQACLDHVKKEYELVADWCRRNDLQLNEALLKLLLVPPDDLPCMECVKALCQPGTSASSLLVKEEVLARVDAYMKSIGLGPPEVKSEQSSKHFDSQSNYQNRPTQTAKLTRMSTGSKRVAPKVDCWMTLDEYERLTRGLKTKFRKRTTVGETEDTKGMQAFWPGFMLDRLRLWMPVITDKSSAYSHNPLVNGGSSTTQHAVFQCVHRQPTGHAVSSASRNTAKAIWPVGRHGHVQHGSIDKSFKSCYL